MEGREECRRGRKGGKGEARLPSRAVRRISDRERCIVYFWGCENTPKDFD